jgi:hypothetical protein
MSDYMTRFRRAARSPFDDIMHTEEDGTEWWSAREMMEAMKYKEWRNMENVIRKARSSCRNSGQQPSDHFVDVNKYSNAPGRPGLDVQMTRFGCYLVAMCGDPDKFEVAAAQQYFAVQTRVAELQATKPSEAIAPPRPWSERLRESVQPHMRFMWENHPGCFTVLTTLSTPLLVLEDELIRHWLRPSASDRPDVSIGLCWANYRRAQGLPTVERYAPLWLPDRDKEVWLCVYEDSERGACETWFGREYLPTKLPNYLVNKPSFKQHGQLPPASAADHACLSLTGRPAILKPPIRKQLVQAGGFFKVGDKLPALPSPQRSLFDAFE